MNIRIHFRKLITTVAVVTLGLALTVPGNAVVDVNTSTGMTLASAPLANHGYDPVAYFTKGRAVVGKAEFAATHNGAAYRFSSEANKKKFERNPDRYVPQYGGFCAYGVSAGAKFDGAPHLFKVVNGKLYLNLNEEIQKKWLEDIPGNIRKADANWNKIRGKSPTDLIESRKIK